METTDFKELLRYIWSKFYIVLIIFAITIGLGIFYTTTIQKPLYSATTQVVILNESSNKTLSNNDILLSNNLVNTYTEIVKSHSVLSKTIDELNLSYSTEELAKNITVTPVASTQLINIKVQNEDPATSQNIANEVSTVFKNEIKSIYGLDNIQVVDQATLPDTPYNINLPKQTALYAIIGLVLGLGITTVIFLLDTSIKDSQTIEEHLGLNVIGVIPNVTRK